MRHEKPQLMIKIYLIEELESNLKKFFLCFSTSWGKGYFQRKFFFSQKIKLQDIFIKMEINKIQAWSEDIQEAERSVSFVLCLFKISMN